MGTGPELGKMLRSAPEYEGKGSRVHGKGQRSAPCLGPLGSRQHLPKAPVWLLLAGAREPERCSRAISQPTISEMEAHMLVCRLWVGGQDVVGNSSPTPGAGVAFVCVPW